MFDSIEDRPWGSLHSNLLPFRRFRKELYDHSSDVTERDFSIVRGAGSGVSGRILGFPRH